MREPWAAGRGAGSGCLHSKLPPEITQAPPSHAPPAVSSHLEKVVENCFRGCPSPVLCKILFPCKGEGTASVRPKGSDPHSQQSLQVNQKKRKKKKGTRVAKVGVWRPPKSKALHKG